MIGDCSSVDLCLSNDRLLYEFCLSGDCLTGDLAGDGLNSSLCLSRDLLFGLSSDLAGDLGLSCNLSFEVFLAGPLFLSNEDLSTGDLDLCLLGCRVAGDLSLTGDPSLTGDHLFGDLDLSVTGDLSLSSDFLAADLLFCFDLPDLSISGDFCFSRNLLGDPLLGDLDLEGDLPFADLCLSADLLSCDLDFSGDLCRDLF